MPKKTVAKTHSFCFFRALRNPHQIATPDTMQPSKAPGAVHPSKARDLESLSAARRADPPNAVAPRVLVLVGIPGSGKSTFAKHLTQVGWARVSQDELGDRRACERKFVDLLSNGRNVVVDRCNFDKRQRKHWIDYAKARGSVCGVLVFATPLDVCVARVQEREEHPTLGPGKGSTGVVHGMANSFVFPDRAEGFVFCRVIRETGDIDRVLQELLKS